MKNLKYLFLGVCVVAAGCQGGFSSGTAQPNTILPPNAPQAVASGTPGASKVQGGTAANGTPSALSGTPPPGDVGAYPFSQAAQGFHCPQVQGFTCVLQFNIAQSSPPPKTKPGHHHAPPSPSPAPSPSSSSSPSPSPSPTITLQLVALPSDAPVMSAASPAPQTSALLEIRIHTNADVQLNGTALAQFVLPQEQLTQGRGFAIQLFREAIESRTSHIDKFMGTYANASLSGSTLRFAFTPPPVTIKKDDLWLIVLYGDGSATPAPTPTGSAP